jgi:hypothetical protein
MANLGFPPPRISKYIPIKLEPKPLVFLSLPQREAMYGGAAGGMKTETLLAAALQYCDIPGYSAVLFRRRLQEHTKPNCLIPRAKKWLAPFFKTGEVSWNGSGYSLSFKTKNFDGSEGEPSTLSFGYCYNVDTELQYQGAEYQFIGWDEGTQIKFDDYIYLLSRLRKAICPIHKTIMKFDSTLNKEVAMPNYVDDCFMCMQRKAIPLRVRTATNPGNRSHNDFKDRFQIKKDPASGRFRGYCKDRPFIPSYVEDNPYIDGKSYTESLMQLDPVRGKQLLDGDWDASPDSLYRIENCQWWTNNADYISFNGYLTKPKNMRWFFTVDGAASREDQLGGNETAIGLWGLSDKFHLGLFDALVFKKEIPDIVDEAISLYKKWSKFSPEAFIVEKNGLGVGITQTMTSRGLPVVDLYKAVDKVKFAQTGIIKMNQGRIFLPKDHRPWKKKVMDQVFIWQGLPDEPDDIVDMFSMGPNYVTWQAFDSTQLDSIEMVADEQVAEQSVRVSEDVSFTVPSYIHTQDNLYY